MSIRAQCLAAIPTRLLDWAGVDFSHPDDVLSLLSDPIARQFPPTREYRRQLMKALISRLEAAGTEVPEELYSEYTTLISTSTDASSDDKCYKTYCFDDALRLTLREAAAIISNGTTGLSSWTAAFIMADWIDRHKELLHDKHVVELGCIALG